MGTRTERRAGSDLRMPISLTSTSDFVLGRQGRLQVRRQGHPSL